MKRLVIWFLFKLFPLVLYCFSKKSIHISNPTLVIPAILVKLCITIARLWNITLEPKYTIQSGLRIEYIIMYKQKYWSNEFYESKKISQLLYPLRHHTYTNYMVQPNEPGLNQTRLVSTTNNTKFYYDIQKYWYSNDFPIPPPKYLKQENGFHLSRQLLENYKEKI